MTALVGAVLLLGCGLTGPDDYRACGDWPVLYPVQEVQRNSEAFYADRVLPFWNQVDETDAIVRALPFLARFNHGEIIHEVIREGTLGPHALIRQHGDTAWTHRDEVFGYRGGCRA